MAVQAVVLAVAVLVVVSVAALVAVASRAVAPEAVGNIALSLQFIQRITIGNTLIFFKHTFFDAAP